jgi:multidrug efflux pump subunit AcrA (membrane-fusion protein)
MSVEDRVLRLENAFATLVEIQRGLDERFDNHEKWINELGAAQAELTKAQAELAQAQAESAQAQAELAQAQARTEERLNTLIDVFERHLSEGREGKP